MISLSELTKKGIEHTPARFNINNFLPEEGKCLSMVITMLVKISVMSSSPGARTKDLFIHSEALYPLGHWHLRLPGHLGISVLWILMLRWKKGKRLISKRFISSSQSSTPAVLWSIEVTVSRQSCAKSFDQSNHFLCLTYFFSVSVHSCALTVGWFKSFQCLGHVNSVSRQSCAENFGRSNHFLYFTYVIRGWSFLILQ